MNCRLSTIPLLTMLNLGFVTPEAKFIQQIPTQIQPYDLANQAGFTFPIAAQKYTPPKPRTSHQTGRGGRSLASESITDPARSTTRPDGE